VDSGQLEGLSSIFRCGMRLAAEPSFRGKGNCDGRSMGRSQVMNIERMMPYVLWKEMLGIIKPNSKRQRGGGIESMAEQLH
jgi:hypothetical protein